MDDEQRVSPPCAEDGHPGPTVVGIGASAGGLAALKTFFAEVPADSGLAWVVVVHLAPEHESHLAELLQPHAAVSVRQVAETVLLEKNRVYVIPPNANLEAIDTHLRLSSMEERRRERAPIDHFFRTLAETRTDDAIGVVLTGTGSDGTLGLKEIKGKGGLTVVQDPNEAEYDGMPQSAIASAVVDLVLPLAEIPDAVVRYARAEPRVPIPDEGKEAGGQGSKLLEEAFSQVRSRTGRDFSRYKRSTILRRIGRRMQLLPVEELSEYVDVLRARPDEARALGDDLLITVTSFFRDPEVFEALEKDVIPSLFEEKGAGDEIRVWCVGCATGEEAYSLAMLLAEEADRRETPPRIQIFASDLHERSLETAREGFYPGDIEGDIEPGRLERFFQKENGGYRVRKQLRELVVFAPHDLLGDPPFSRVDLVSCRNLLIYLERGVQARVAGIFHYALKPDGFLVLGTSETVAEADLFRVQDEQSCIYRKRNVPTPVPRLSVFPSLRSLLPDETEAEPARRRSGDPAAYGPLHQRMVERYAPPSLLVSPEDHVVHLSAHAGRYLTHPGGELTSDVYELVRKEMRMELRSVVHGARDGGEPRRTGPIPVQFDDETRLVVAHARPALDPADEGFVLVIFDERPARGTDEDAGTPHAGGGMSESDRVRELEAERERDQERLQSLVKEHETSRERMEASFEELQSTNEELRSTMEELETSKEELQSMNEELQTVNQENRHKAEELAQISADMQNLLIASEIATLFLDRELRILRFTPQVSELFNVRTTDRGRPISDLTHRLGYDDLTTDVREVLDQLAPVEREIEDAEGRWHLTRILPYRSGEDRIEGVVITFVDITGRKHAEEELRDAKVFAESVIDTLHEPLLVLDPDLRVKSANPAFYEHFDLGPEVATGRLIYELAAGQWDIPALRTLLDDVLPENKVFSDFEIEQDFEDIGHRVMLLNGRRLDHVQLILLGIRDVTDRKRKEEELRKAKAEAEEAARSKGQFLSTMSHDLRTPLNAVIGLADLVTSQIVGPVNEKQQEYLDRIKASARYQLAMIEDILGFAQAEAGQEHVSLDRTDVAEVVRDVTGMLEGVAGRKGLDIVVRGADETVTMVTDGGKVRQVMTNLVGNAVKFTAKGTVEVELEKGEDGLTFRVRDTGPGIPADRLEDIFEPFVQVATAGTGKEGGTGLGLAVSRRLARLLGGDVEVESEPGEGSVFAFRLPYPPEEA